MGGTVPISTAPAVDPAMIERSALGLSFAFSGDLAGWAVAIANITVVGPDWVLLAGEIHDAVEVALLANFGVGLKSWYMQNKVLSWKS